MMLTKKKKRLGICNYFQCISVKHDLPDSAYFHQLLSFSRDSRGQLVIRSNNSKSSEIIIGKHSHSFLRCKYIQEGRERWWWWGCKSERETIKIRMKSHGTLNYESETLHEINFNVINISISTNGTQVVL